MPFSKKLPNLGHTERIRVPSSCVAHVSQILKEYERLCGTHGITYVGQIQQKVITGLEQIP
tara:strand:- start:34265 stop:34447 length:183 start_codon:yes stop_codon:yes gene_type:complete